MGPLADPKQDNNNFNKEDALLTQFEKIREVRISIHLLSFTNEISIEFRIRLNNLLQKFLQADMIFFYQLLASSVTLGKCFAEFIIHVSIALT